jgi:hypothetical protein
MDFDYYFNEAGDVQYCYYGNQYTWNPYSWGYYPGWTMIWTGLCDDYLQWEINYYITYYWTVYYYTSYYNSDWEGEWW